MTIVAGATKIDAACSTVRTHPNMDFKQIQYFIAFFEEGSVTRVAKRINIMQPTLNMQITKFEDEFGQELFERIPHGMTPAAAGQMMHRLFLPIMHDLASARQRMMQHEEHTTGHITISIAAPETESILAKVLTRLNTSYPNTEVSTTDGFGTALIDLISTNRFDTAVIRHQRGRLALRVQSLRDEEMALVMSTANDPGLPESMEMTKLPGLEPMLPTKSHDLRMILGTATQMHDVTLAPKSEIDILGTIVQFVEAIRSAAVLPRIVVQCIVREGRLRMHTIVVPCTIRHLVYVGYPQWPLSTATETLVAIATEEIKRASGIAQRSGGRCTAHPTARTCSGRNGTS